MQSVDLCDTVTLNVTEALPPTISVRCDHAEIPTDQKNLAYRAADAFYSACGVWKRTEIEIEKRIPVSAGLAGGSTDAAAVLVGLNRLMGSPFSEKELCEIGKQLGADIPFCIHNKIALVKGIGEDLTFINDNHFQAHLLLVKPKKGVSTKRCFESLNIPESSHPDIDKMKQGIQENDYEKVVASLGNTLETPSLKMVKDIEKIKDEMRSMGFDGALMSGSGSCVFGITQDEELIERAIPFFRARYPFVRKTKILER
jgi:4-diphosphocytidyl-2-C-methyl-D-erythritol kinase